MPATRRFSAIMRQRCPVCLQGVMFTGLFTMNPSCPRCGHAFMREPGFFQGAMYVSYGLGLLVFLALGFLANAMLATRIGLVPALFVAFVFYVPVVPVLYRYARVIWAHVNIVTLPPSERTRSRSD